MSEKMISFDGIEIPESAIIAKGFDRRETELERKQREFHEFWHGRQLITSTTSFGFELVPIDSPRDEYPAAVQVAYFTRRNIWASKDARDAAAFFGRLALAMEEVEDAK